MSRPFKINEIINLKKYAKAGAGWRRGKANTSQSFSTLPPKNRELPAANNSRAPLYELDKQQNFVPEEFISTIGYLRLFELNKEVSSKDDRAVLQDLLRKFLVIDRLKTIEDAAQRGIEAHPQSPKAIRTSSFKRVMSTIDYLPESIKNLLKKHELLKIRLIEDHKKVKETFIRFNGTEESYEYKANVDGVMCHPEIEKTLNIEKEQIPHGYPSNRKYKDVQALFVPELGILITDTLAAQRRGTRDLIHEIGHAVEEAYFRETGLRISETEIWQHLQSYAQLHYERGCSSPNKEFLKIPKELLNECFVEGLTHDSYHLEYGREFKFSNRLNDFMQMMIHNPKGFIEYIQGQEKVHLSNRLKAIHSLSEELSSHGLNPQELAGFSGSQADLKKMLVKLSEDLQEAHEDNDELAKGIQKLFPKILDESNSFKVSQTQAANRHEYVAEDQVEVKFETNVIKKIELLEKELKNYQKNLAGLQEIESELLAEQKHDYTLLDLIHYHQRQVHKLEFKLNQYKDFQKVGIQRVGFYEDPVFGRMPVPIPEAHLLFVDAWVLWYSREPVPGTYYANDGSTELGWFRCDHNIDKLLGSTPFYNETFWKVFPNTSHFADALFRRNPQIGHPDNVEYRDARVGIVPIIGIEDKVIIQLFSPCGIRTTAIADKNIAEAAAAALLDTAHAIIDPTGEKPIISNDDHINVHLLSKLSKINPELAAIVQVGEQYEAIDYTQNKLLLSDRKGNLVTLSRQLNMQRGTGYQIVECTGDDIPVTPTFKDDGPIKLPDMPDIDGIGKRPEDKSWLIQAVSLPSMSAVLNTKYYQPGQYGLFAVKQQTTSQEVRPDALEHSSVKIIGVQEIEGKIHDNEQSMTLSEFHTLNQNLNQTIPLIDSSAVLKLLEPNHTIMPLGIIQPTDEGIRIVMVLKDSKSGQQFPQELTIEEFLRFESLWQNTPTIPLTSNPELAERASHGILAKIFWTAKGGYLCQRLEFDSTQEKRSLGNSDNTKVKPTGQLIHVTAQDLSSLQRLYIDAKMRRYSQDSKEGHTKRIAKEYSHILGNLSSDPMIARAFELYVTHPELRKQIALEFPELSHLDPSDFEGKLKMGISKPFSNAEIKIINNVATYNDHPVLDFAWKDGQGQYVINIADSLTGKAVPLPLTEENYKKLEMLPGQKIRLLGERLTPEQVKKLFPKGPGKIKPIQGVLNNCYFVEELYRALLQPGIAEKLISLDENGHATVVFPIAPDRVYHVRKEEYTKNGSLNFELPSLIYADRGSKILEIAYNEFTADLGYEGRYNHLEDVPIFPIEGTSAKTNLAAPLAHRKIKAGSVISNLTGWKTIHLFNGTIPQERTEAMSKKAELFKKKLLAAADKLGIAKNKKGKVQLQQLIEEIKMNEEVARQIISEMRINPRNLSQSLYLIDFALEDHNTQVLSTSMLPNNSKDATRRINFTNTDWQNDFEAEESFSINDRDTILQLFQHLAEHQSSYSVVFGISKYSKGIEFKGIKIANLLKGLITKHAYSVTFEKNKNGELVAIVSNSHTPFKQKMSLDELLNYAQQISITVHEKEINWKTGIDLMNEASI